MEKCSCHDCVQFGMDMHDREQYTQFQIVRDNEEIDVLFWPFDKTVEIVKKIDGHWTTIALKAEELEEISNKIKALSTH